MKKPTRYEKALELKFFRVKSKKYGKFLVLTPRGSDVEFFVFCTLETSFCLISLSKVKVQLKRQAQDFVVSVKNCMFCVQFSG